MTTQNTHSEHSDAEWNVEEHLPASEISTSFSEEASPAPTSEEQQEYLDDSSKASPEDAEPILQQEEAQINNPDFMQQDSQVVSNDEPVDTYIAPPIVVEEEVRPFTDFIEEFRQAEARFNSSLQDYQADSFSMLTSTSAELEPTSEVPFPASGEENREHVTEAPVFETGERIETIVGEVPATPATEQDTTPIEAALANLAVSEEIRAPATQEDAETKPETAPAATRPVSPLLRPATPRLRVHRHGSGRHQEESPTGNMPPQETQTSQEIQTPQETPDAVEVPAEEQPVVEAQPKPARRYRFDRPAATTTNTSSSTAPVTPPAATQARTDEGKEALVRSATARSENGHATNEHNIQTSEKDVTPPPQVSEHFISRQPVSQEPPVAPVAQAPEVNTSSTAQSVQEPERQRRHGQERQRSKEQASAPTSTSATPPFVVETTPPIAEEVTPQNVEANPEDLPPLEYSELQKASSRRRRRRHSSSAVAPVAAASTPLTSAAPSTTTPKEVEQSSPAATAQTTPTPASPVVTPRTPMAPAAQAPTSTNATPPSPTSTMTSGYTVSQMNQSHNGANPFMGPEPSPARGSIAAQNVRSIRTDVQRTPAYPVRTTEATSASVQQLANVVSQAIQTQTDRMIAELRRTNQSPTNISVSMPPFPSNERVGVFVDVANLLYSARTLRITVDFGKLLDFLRGNRRLVRAHAYCPTSPQPGDEQMFLQAVKGLGYRITTKNYKTFSSGAKKADLDLDLCMDVVRLVDGKAVDCVVLVSGDSDFMPMLDYCSDHGVRVEVAAFDEAMSATLRQSCDLFINLSMLDEIRV